MNLEPKIRFLNMENEDFMKSKDNSLLSGSEEDEIFIRER